MNSYLEELQATTAALLQGQALELKTVDSEANAAMFTLYCAQGALQNANDKLVGAKDALEVAGLTKRSAFDNKNKFQTLQGTAATANDYIKQSITNVAVSAANVQIATNAIVRLASNMGSIYSILNAAEIDSDILKQATEAYKLMNDTAYDAELASKLAMEASFYTAEISTSSVLEDVKNCNNSMDNLLKILSAGFDAAKQEMVNRRKKKKKNQSQKNLRA